jgi:Reverse transcriptase (RNA-dependent DNA polymerase)
VRASEFISIMSDGPAPVRDSPAIVPKPHASSIKDLLKPGVLAAAALAVSRNRQRTCLRRLIQQLSQQRKRLILAPAPPQNEPLLPALASVSSPSCRQQVPATNAAAPQLALTTAMPSTAADLLSARRSIKEARARPDADEWRQVHDAELRRHDTELLTWTYEDPLPADKPLPFTIGYKARTNMFGGLERRKARCAIRGDRMRSGVDFDEMRTASHMPSQGGRRFLLAVAAAEGSAVQSWDVPGAYMRAPADPRYRVTRQQPPNFDGTLAAPGKVCVIRRALPGAPDANALWEHFRDYWLQNWGWTQVLSEPSMFIQEVGPGLYARTEADNDDFLITAPTEAYIDRLARPLEAAWQITKQKLSRWTPIMSKERPTAVATDTLTDDPSSMQRVGLRIERMPDGGLKLSNPKLIVALLSRHGMADCNPTILPHVASATLHSTQDGEPLVDPSAYRVVVGSLRFLADTTHPLIAHPVGVLGRHLVRLALRYMVATKNGMRYLRGNVNTGIVFPRSDVVRIEGHTDSDYANCTDTRFSGVLVTVNGSPVHWSSSHQTTVTHSSTEAENIAADSGARVLVWLAQLADDLRVPLVKRSTTLTIDDKPVATYHNGVVITDERRDLALRVDKKGAIDMAHAHGPTKRTKNLNVRHHYLQQCVARKILFMKQCTTDEQLADCLTKPLGRVKFLQAFQLLQHRD